MASKRTVVTLYTIGNTPLSRRAISNLKKIMSEPGVSAMYTLEIKDLLENPALAEQNNILATPVLIKKRPSPEQRIVGDFTDTNLVLDILGISRDQSLD